SLMQWDPRNETLEEVVLHERVPGLKLPISDHLMVNRLAGDAAGKWYLPEIGWYDPQTRQLSFDGPKPQQEMVWFERRGNAIWGLGGEPTQRTVGKWDLETGEVTKVCSISDAQHSTVVLT